MAEVLEKNEQIHLKYLTSLQRVNNYDVEEISSGYAKIVYRLDEAQVLEDGITIFEGELFKVANFCALAAVNEESIFVINANVDFLSQVELASKKIVFEAKTMNSSLGKKFLEVRGKIDEIVVFLGSFTVLKLDNRSKIKV